MTRVIFGSSVLSDGLMINEHVGPFATEAKLENIFMTIEQGKKFKEFRDDENPVWLVNTTITVVGPMINPEDGKVTGTKVLVTGDKVKCVESPM